MEVRGSYPLSKLFSLYAELEAKTKGWVAGNSYLDENVTFRTGILLDLAK